MDDMNEPGQEPTSDIKLNLDQQSQVADMTAHTALPSLKEMLDVISESAELTQNLQALMLTSPCTNNSDDSTVTYNSADLESKAKQEPESTDSTLEPSSQCRKTTTSVTCYDSNFQAFYISLQHQDSLELNVEAKNCEQVVIGDGTKVNICQFIRQERPLNQNENCGSNGSRACSLLEADGDADVAGLPTRRKRKKRQPKREKSTTNENLESGKIRTEWQFPMFLCDFPDSEILENDIIDQWLANLISSLLSEAQDLDDFESVTKLLDEAMKLRESSIPNCIIKLAKAIQCMSTLVGNEDSTYIIRYNVLLSEIQFALAESYTKEGDYLAALRCLKTLESSLILYQETQKSRLYAKIAKIMEKCLEFSVDFTSYEIEIEGASSASVSNGNPAEVVLCYFQKALNFSNKEPSAAKREIIQRCCYLGKAAVLMKCWKKQNDNVKDLTEVRENLFSTERLYDSISPAMKCQFYLIEAFLLYYDGRYQMATYKAQEAYKIADKEHFLERKCLGSKRLHFLLAELDKVDKSRVKDCTDLLEHGEFEEVLDI